MLTLQKFYPTIMRTAQKSVKRLNCQHKGPVVFSVLSDTKKSIKWIRAFSIWAFEFVDTHQAEGKGLFQHLHQNLDGDWQYVWGKVYKYDKAVRQNITKDNNLKMGVTHLKLLQNISEHIKRPFQMEIRPSPSRNKNKSFGKRGKAPCQQFNDGSCIRENCRFTHVCKFCHTDSHTKLHCKNRNIGNIDGARH